MGRRPSQHRPADIGGDDTTGLCDIPAGQSRDDPGSARHVEHLVAGVHAHPLDENLGPRLKENGC